ncbi:hypothetical protein Tco_0356498, partial [Tanacetum coccineum]
HPSLQSEKLNSEGLSAEQLISTGASDIPRSAKNASCSSSNI